MSNGSNCDRKSQLSEILTEPLNPRAPSPTPTPHCVSLYMLKKKCCYSKLRCRVWESNPPANILWFLDGQRILDQGKTVAWNKTRKKKNKFSLNFQSIYIAGI